MVSQGNENDALRMYGPCVKFKERQRLGSWKNKEGNLKCTLQIV